MEITYPISKILVSTTPEFVSSKFGAGKRLRIADRREWRGGGLGIVIVRCWLVG